MIIGVSERQFTHQNQGEANPTKKHAASRPSATIAVPTGEADNSRATGA